MPDADRADAEWFLDKMLVTYPTLGIDALEIAAQEPAPPQAAHELLFDQRGAQGCGRETRDGSV